MAKDSDKMHDRSGWEMGGRGPRYIKGRNYPDLVEFKRPCKTCGQSFSIYVTPRIAEGFADTNNFAFRNCEIHRRQAKDPETTALRTKDRVMGEELLGAYQTERELRTKIEALERELEKTKNKWPWEK